MASEGVLRFGLHQVLPRENATKALSCTRRTAHASVRPSHALITRGSEEGEVCEGVITGGNLRNVQVVQPPDMHVAVQAPTWPGSEHDVWSV